jgi:hypothetical protein
VIDGGHRLSALRAWMEDDYGDGAISQAFHNVETPADQKRIAKRTGSLKEGKVRRFLTLKSAVGNKAIGDVILARRAGSLFTRPLIL